MKPLMLVLATLLTASFASAEPVITKDWMTSNGPDEVFAKDACLAATNVATGTNRAQLLLSFTKDKATVPQLLLKVWDQTAPEAQLLIKVSAKVTYPLFLYKTASQVGEPNIYWYAPIGWSPLMDFIAAATTLSVQGTATKLDISLKGSAVSLQKTASCLKADKILPLDFLKKLNTKTETQSAVYASVDEMIQGNERAFEVYRNGLVKTKELADLRKSAAKPLAQEAEAQTAYNTAQTRFQSGTDALNAQLASQAKMQTDLAQATADLQRQQADLVPAAETKKVKKVAYDPVLAQFTVFTNAVESRQDALDSNIRSTRSYQSRISELESSIPRLSNEMSSLQSRISSLSSDVDRARRDFRDKQSDADSYRVDSEYRSELSRDFQYSNYLRDAERFRQEGNRYANDERSERNAQRSADAQLRNCRNQTPPQNCTQYENEVRNRENAANQAQQRARSAINNANNAQSQAESRARSILSNIERKKRDLESTADDAQRRYNSLQSDLDSLQSRYNQIANTLPSMRNELSDARSQVSLLQSQRPGLEQALADATAKMNAARTQLDFDRIKGEYVTASNAVSALESAIAKSKQTIANSEAGLKKIKPVIDELTKDLALKTQKRDDAAQKLAAIQETLKPFRAQEAALQATIADLATQFEDGKARYQRTYEGWIAPVAPANWMLSIGSF